MTTTRTIVASAAEQTATVRSIADILTSISGHETDITKHGPLCVWFGIQNKDAVNSLYNQSDDTAGATDHNIEVTAGTYQQFPPCDVKYDLEEEYIRVGANNQVFSITIMWG